jgi:hypothetical protein
MITTRHLSPGARFIDATLQPDDAEGSDGVLVCIGQAPGGKWSFLHVRTGHTVLRGQIHFPDLTLVASDPHLEFDLLPLVGADVRLGMRSGTELRGRLDYVRWRSFVVAGNRHRLPVALHVDGDIVNISDIDGIAVV